MRWSLLIAAVMVLLGSTAALARAGWDGPGSYAWFIDEASGPTIYAGPFATEQECRVVADTAPKQLSVTCSYFGSQVEWDNK